MAATSGRIGERVVAYVDHIGRIEGIIARQLPDGFALSITSSRHKREKFAAQLTWLANRHLLPEQRRHPRIPPRHSSAQLIFPNGVHVTCRVIDISQSGAGIASNQRPTLGSLVTLGKTAARVARYIDDGFAVEFIRLQHPDSLEENVTVRIGGCARRGALRLITPLMAAGELEASRARKGRTVNSWFTKPSHSASSLDESAPCPVGETATRDSFADQANPG